MASVVFTLSVINICMFVLAMIGSVNTLRYVEESHKAPYLKSTIVVFLLFTFLMSLWFVIAKGLWLLNDYNSLVGDTSSILRLVYDYAKAIHTLSAVVMVYIYLRWVGKAELIHHPERRRRRTNP